MSRSSEWVQRRQSSMRYRSGVSVCGECVTSSSILIVGNPGEIHVGRHLLHAAQEAGIHASVCDTTSAYAGSKVQRTYSWRLRGHRPANLAAFSRQVVDRKSTRLNS